MERYPYSKSAIGVFQLCKRKYAYTYIDKRQSIEPASYILRFGQTWHKAMEVGYWPNLDLPYEEHVEACIDAAQDYDPECGGLLMGVMLACYIDRWSEQAKNFELIETEGEYVKDHSRCNGVDVNSEGLGNEPANMAATPTPFRYILDARVREKSTGAIYRIEHKTTRKPIEPSSDYWSLEFDLQLGLYEALDRPADGTVYCVAKVPPLRPGKIGRRVIEEDDDEFIERASKEIQKNYDKWFAREPVATHGGVMNDAHAEIAGIEFYKAHGHWPRNANACGSWGRKCEFYTVCTGEDSLADNDLFQIRKKRK